MRKLWREEGKVQIVVRTKLNNMNKKMEAEDDLKN